MLGNINILNKVIARKNNLPESMVEAVNDFYFKRLEQNLKTSEEINFFLKSLGTISVSYHKIKGEILRTIYLLRAVRNKEYKNQERKEEIIQQNTEYLKLLWKQYKKVSEIRFTRLAKTKEKLNFKYGAQKQDTSTDDSQTIQNLEVNRAGVLHFDP